MKKLFFGLSLLILTCFHHTTALGEHETKSQTLKPLKIGLDWHPNPLHLLLIIAKENGYFKAGGFDATFVPHKSVTEAIRHLKSGSNDLVVMDEARFKFYMRPQSLKHIYTTIDIPIEVMISHKPIDQLKGGTIYHQSSGTGLTYTALLRTLEKNDLKPEDLKIIYSKHKTALFFIQKRMDAALNIMRPFELETIREHVPDLVVIELFKGLAGQIIVGNEGPHKWKSIPKILKKARTWVLENPDAAIDMFKKKYPEQASLFTKKTTPMLLDLFKIHK